MVLGERVSQQLSSTKSLEIGEPKCGERELAMTEMGSVAVVADESSTLFDPKCEEADKVAMEDWSNAPLITDPAFELGALGAPDPPVATLCKVEPRE